MATLIFLLVLFKKKKNCKVNYSQVLLLFLRNILQLLQFPCWRYAILKFVYFSAKTVKCTYLWMIIIFCKFILERDQLSIELLYKSVIYIYIFFKNKFAKILLLLLIEFKIDTLFPSVTVKLRCERGGGGSRIEDRDSSSIDYFYSRLAVGTASS